MEPSNGSDGSRAKLEVAEVPADSFGPTRYALPRAEEDRVFVEE